MSPTTDRIDQRGRAVNSEGGHPRRDRDRASASSVEALVRLFPCSLANCPQRLPVQDSEDAYMPYMPMSAIQGDNKGAYPLEELPAVLTTPASGDAVVGTIHD